MSELRSNLESRVAPSRQPTLSVGPHWGFAYGAIIFSPLTWFAAFTITASSIPSASIWLGHRTFEARWSSIVVILVFSFWRLVCYFNTRYLVDGNKLLIQSGILWKDERVIPFSLVYNCRCTKSPIQSRLRSGTISILMADGERARISWVLEPDLIRELLLSDKPRVVMSGT